MFNTFVDTFIHKLLILLDDVEKFFLWVVAVILNGRRIGFEWLNLVWENKHEWRNVTYEYKIVHYLKSEVRQNIANQVRVDLLLCMSIPFKCRPQAPTLLLGWRVVEPQEDPGMSYIIV